MDTKLALFISLFFGCAHAITPKVFWQGVSGGFKVTLSEADVSATDDKGKLVLSLKNDFQDYIKKSCEPDAEEGHECTRTYTAVSLVGPYLSLRTFSAAYTGGAHPSAVSSFLTIDLRDQSKEVSLLSWFDDANVAGELAKDKILKKHLKLKKEAPVTLAALESGFTAPDDCSFAFYKSSAVQSFAFYSTSKEKVAVRIGLSHACEVARGSLTQFGILLPIPSALAADLKAASEKKAGFLMADARKILPQEVTFFWQHQTP